MTRIICLSGERFDRLFLCASNSAACLPTQRMILFVVSMNGETSFASHKEVSFPAQACERGQNSPQVVQVKILKYFVAILFIQNDCVFPALFIVLHDWLCSYQQLTFVLYFDALTSVHRRPSL
jgi:hypothetical protein